MKKALAQALIDLVDDHGDSWVEHRLYEGYSGRGMSGEETYGVVTDTPEIYMVVLLKEPAEWAKMLEDDEELQEAAQGFHGFKSDRLGHDTILY